MRHFHTIPIQADQPTSHNQILSVLHEIHHALNQLSQHNQENTIDFLNLPLSDSDKRELLNILGKGEVTAHLDASGNSVLWESTFPGVWIVEHYDVNTRLLSQLIEITWIPSILKSHPEDVRVGLEKLTTRCKTLTH